MMTQYRALDTQSEKELGMALDLILTQFIVILSEYYPNEKRRFLAQQNLLQQSEFKLYTLQLGEPTPPLLKLLYAAYQSEFVYQFLQKTPHILLKWWDSPPTWTQRPNYSQQLIEQLARIPDEKELYRQLRLFRHLHLVTLSYWQSNGLVTVEEIFLQLSELAESLVLATYHWLYPRLCQQIGTPCNLTGDPQPMLILGMGKLGGRELNFSSDIDLIFTYPEKGETRGGRRCLENEVFFQRLAQQLIHALDTVTVDGFVYRVDMRLRPFGEVGALVQSFAAMEDYYQEQGRDWERYAMLKARILGEQQENRYHQQLNQLLRPFIYRRYIDFSVIQALRSMKQMIRNEVRRRNLQDNIKLGIGGIREIEFIVQAFQLIRGGREKVLQQRSLLTVLPYLVRLGFITTTQKQDLQQAYLWLRYIENTLQAIHDEQTQTLPKTLEDQQRLIHACRMFSYYDQRLQINYQPRVLSSWQDFCAFLSSHQQKVRLIFENLIGEEKDVKSSDERSEQWQSFLEGQFSQIDIEEWLAPWGLDSSACQKISEILFQFQREVSQRPIGQRGREVLNRLFPRLLDLVSQQDNQVDVLPKLLNVLSKTLTRTTYLELLLEHPQVLERLTLLCAKSKMIAEQIATHPILLDELLDEQQLLHPIDYQTYPTLLQQYLIRIPEEDEEQQIEALRQFKQATMLQVAAADILGGLSVMKVSDHLTALAETLIQHVFNLAWKQMVARFGTPDHLKGDAKNFLILGYGKLGGIELGYKSDLDLVFLYSAPTQGYTQGGKRRIESSLFYLRLAQKMVGLFNLNTFSGVLYDIDIRLRPSGEAGLLVSGISAFAHYQQQEAWTWETQALVRARAVSGDPLLMREFNRIRQQVLAQPRDIKVLQREVQMMRQKMYQHLSHPDPSYFNIKTDWGGITDIEFLAQFLVLANAHCQPKLAYWSDNIRIFDDMAKYSIIPLVQAEKLKSIYVTLRNQIHHLNLLGESAVVSADIFYEERHYIQQCWLQYIESKKE